MHKIGILTLYYKNYNYGGQLQAYALQKAIANKGYYAEQIAFKRNPKKLIFRKLRGFLEEPFTFNVFKVTIKLFVNRLSRKTTSDASMSLTYKKFDEFMDLIPHSKVVDSNSIAELNDEYDLFVAGSDQVWNPLYVTDEFFFSFVEDKPRISYAASIRINKFEKSEGKRFKKYLDSFNYISVREEKAARILNTIGVESSIDIMPDPTFLLDREEWNAISSNNCLKFKYIFVYLVKDPISLSNIETYAKRNGYKVVLIPEPGISIHENDVFIKLNEGIGPSEFLSLIRDAEFVIANSFHGTVFSLIFNKQFIVYGNERTDDRKATILKKFGLMNRLVSNDFDYCQLENNEIDYDRVNITIDQIRKESNTKLSYVISSVFGE